MYNYGEWVVRESPARGPVALERVERARTQPPSILPPLSRMSGVSRRGERHHRQREGDPGDHRFPGRGPPLPEEHHGSFDMDQDEVEWLTEED
jgi:hypothetical protein